jgi:hypothetical protein
LSIIYRRIASPGRKLQPETSPAAYFPGPARPR